jgi:hypothetical protein
VALSNLVRQGGGLASIVAGVLLLIGHSLDLGGDPEYGTVLGGTLVLLAHVALVFALVALYAAQAERAESSRDPSHGGFSSFLRCVPQILRSTATS